MIRNLNNKKKPYQVGNVTPDGLEYYWKFNDSPTDDVQGLDAVLNGNSTYVNSPENKGLSVGQTISSYASFNDYTSGKSEFSVSFLFNVDGTTNTSMLNNWYAASNSRNLLIRVRSNALQVYIFKNGNTYSSSNTLDISSLYNQWNHITVSHGDTFTKVYLNGSLIYSNVTASGIIEGIPIYPLYLGLSHEGRGEGKYDMLGFWNKALTATEVLNNYNLEIAGIPLI